MEKNKARRAMARAREWSHLCGDVDQRRSLIRWYLSKVLEGGREQAMHLSTGRAFNSKCKGHEVIDLMVLRNNNETMGLEEGKSGNQIMVGRMSGAGPAMQGPRVSKGASFQICTNMVVRENIELFQMTNSHYALAWCYK